MSLFIQSLVALAASVSAAPAAGPDAVAEPAPVVSVETQEKVEFAPNLAAKLDSVTPRAEENAIKIWGESWPQHTWWEVQSSPTEAQPAAPEVSATEAFRRVSCRS